MEASGHHRLGGQSAVLLLALFLLTASCTGSDDAPETTSTASTLPASTTSSSATTTTLAAALDELLRSTLASDDFSAAVAAELVTTQPIGTISASGSGSINAADSELRLTSDLTGLLGTFVDPKGRVIGQLGLSEISQASIVVDGVQYRQEDNDRWRISTAAEPNTTLGHVVAMLRNVPAFDEGAVEVVNGRELIIMHPAEPVEYDPRFFDLDPNAFQSFDADTSVLVDAEGLPVQIRITLQADVESGDTVLTTVIELTYAMSSVGSTPAIQPPQQAWVSLGSLGFMADDTGFVDMEVPADWVVASRDAGVIVLDAPEGHRLAAILGVAPEKLDIEATWPETLRLLDAVPDSVIEPDFSVFPSRFATQDNLEFDNFVMVYHESQLGSLLFTVVWSGPRDSFDLQQETFEDILSTVTWLNFHESGFMPGGTLGDETLQSDTLGPLLSLASATSACDEPLPAWTDLVSGGFDAWTEDWYVNTCGNIEIYEVIYTESPGGGTTIAIISEVRQPDE